MTPIYSIFSKVKLHLKNNVGKKDRRIKKKEKKRKKEKKQIPIPGVEPGFHG